jgi:hypothetical protein
VKFTAPTVREAIRFYTAACQIIVPVRQQSLWNRLESLPEVQRARREWNREWIAQWLTEPSPFRASPRIFAS